MTTDITSRVRLGLTPAVDAIGVILIALTVAGAVVHAVLRRAKRAREAARLAEPAPAPSRGRAGASRRRRPPPAEPAASALHIARQGR